MVKSNGFHINLNRNIEPDIERLISTGSYETITEVIRAGIRELIRVHFPNAPYAEELNTRSPPNFTRQQTQKTNRDL